MTSHQDQRPSKPSRVLLTRSSGFIGAIIRRWLEADTVPALGLADINLLAAGASERFAMVHPDDAVVMHAALTPDMDRDITTLMKNLDLE